MEKFIEATSHIDDAHEMDIDRKEAGVSDSKAEAKVAPSDVLCFTLFSAERGAYVLQKCTD